MRLRSSFTALLMFLFAGIASPLHAQLFWDIDTTNKAGAGGTAPSGTWSSSKADWNVNADGTGIPRTWIPGETAIFAAGTAVTGPYTVTVTGTQSLAGLTVEEGTVTQNGGTLDFGAEAASIYTSAGATWAQSTTSIFAGSGGLYKNGPGTLLFRGSNIFSNSTAGPYLTINAGVVDFNVPTNLGAAPLSPNSASITINGGTLRFSGTTAPLNPNRGVLIGDSGATIEAITGLFALPAGASPTAALTGAGTITKTGVGRFELQTAQTTFTGKYVVKNGSLGITTDGTLGAVPTTTQADYFTLDGGGIYGDNSNGITLNAKRGITLGASGGFLAFIGTGLNPYDGIISGTAGGGLRIAVDDALTANSAGVVTLNGANTYNGPTEIDTNATLVLGIIADGGTSSGLGKSSNAASNLILSGGTLRYAGAAVSTDRNFMLTSAGGFIDASGANNAALKFSSTSTIGIAGTGGRILVLRGASTGDNTMSLAIVDQGANATTLTKTDAGTWVLSNPANSYTGNTSISTGGRLKLGASGVIPDASLVQLFSSSVFDLNGFDETVRSISSTSGTVALGTKSLILNNPNGETYAASIIGTGGGRIIKNGTGKFTLNPTTATYDGGVTLNAGALGVGTSAALGIGTLVINNTVTFDNATSSAITLTNGVTLNGEIAFDDSTFISNPGNLTWGSSGSHQWTISGANRVIRITSVPGTYTVTINQPIGEDAPGRTLTKDGNSKLTLTAMNTYTGNTQINYGTLSVTKPYFADASAIYMTTFAYLNLDFTPGTVDTINAFYIDNVLQATGLWGAIGSGAAHETALITGPGLLQVGAPVFSIPGDFNGDGRVDASDYLFWRKDTAAHGGSSGYSAWRQSFGNSPGAGAGSNVTQTSVPEPATIMLLPIAIFALDNLRKRKRAAGFIPAVQ